MNELCKRFIDLMISTILLTILLVPMLIISILIKTTSKGPVIYWSERVGHQNKIFLMPKFRTMLVGTPNVASEQLNNPQNWITPIGSFLRKTSLDEIPQLYVVLSGKMSLVGPRPALFNQYELIKLRKKFSIDSLRPGVTGWAQINGRDNLTIFEKVRFDKFYLSKKSCIFDLWILLLTIFYIFKSNDISH